MTEDIVPDARAGATVEKSVEAPAVVCSAAGVKLELLGAIGYGIGRKPRTDSGKADLLALEKSGSSGARRSWGGCSALKHFKPNFLLFLECLYRRLIKTFFQEPNLCRRKRVGLPRQQHGNLL